MPDEPASAARQRVDKRWRRAALAGALIAVLVATVAMVIWLGRDDPRSVAAAPTSSAVQLVPPSTSAPVRTPPAPAVPHASVAPAAPSAFTISGPAFTIKARVCSMDATLPLDPPGEQHHTVCWVNTRFGVAPGSATGTSFILGHAWAQDRSEVLNKLSARATEQLLRAKPRVVDGVKTYPVTALNGYVVTLRTPHGVLRYRVRDAYGVNKYEAHNLHAMWDGAIRNRVVIITCAERNGVDYVYNVVVDAYLISSKRPA